MDSREKIREAAKGLNHDWIILDALKENKSPNLKTYMETIRKIKKIEARYSEGEIMDGNLLCDIW